MLSAYFDPCGRRIRALRDGPAGVLFEGFARALSETGYATITARRYLRAAAPVRMDRPGRDRPSPAAPQTHRPP